MFHIRGEQCCISAAFWNLFAHLKKKSGGATGLNRSECQSQRARSVSSRLPQMGGLVFNRVPDWPRTGEQITVDSQLALANL